MLREQSWMDAAACLALACLLGSCASTPPASSAGPGPSAPDAIREADEQMVQGCEFLGTVVGKSGWGGLAAGTARKGAMRSAKKRAAELGATHLVVQGFDVGSGVTMEASTIEGRAYRCGGP